MISLGFVLSQPQSQANLDKTLSKQTSLNTNLTPKPTPVHADNLQYCAQEKEMIYTLDDRIWE